MDPKRVKAKTKRKRIQTRGSSVIADSNYISIEGQPDMEDHINTIWNELKNRKTVSSKVMFNGSFFSKILTNFQISFIYHGSIIVCRQNPPKKRNPPPLAKIYIYSLFLTFQYLNEFLSSDKDQGMKNILNFSNFSEIFGKRAWHTHNAPKPANENFEIFKIFICRFGCVVGVPSSFFKNFRKVRKF